MDGVIGLFRKKLKYARYQELLILQKIDDVGKNRLCRKKQMAQLNVLERVEGKSR